MSTLLSAYFLAGLLAVVFFFLSAALVGLSLFAAPSGKRKLMLAESVALTLVLGLLTFLSWQLWGELQHLRDAVWPLPKRLGDWGRRVTSVLLLGLSLVFGSLAGCFGWFRAGFAGNGIRTLVWTFLGLKVVTTSLSVLDLLHHALLKGEGSIPAGGLAGVAAPVLEELAEGMLWWLPLCGGIFLLSVVGSVVMRRR